MATATQVVEVKAVTDVAVSILDIDDIDDPNEPYLSSPSYSIEDAESCLLGRIVLARAAEETESRMAKVRTEAREWLTTDSPDLRFVCGLARVSARYVIETWRRRVYGRS